MLIIIMLIKRIYLDYLITSLFYLHFTSFTFIIYKGFNIYLDGNCGIRTHGWSSSSNRFQDDYNKPL